MATRRYYSTRTGKNPNGSQLELGLLLRLFKNTYSNFMSRYYFQEAFGYDCVDEGSVPGTLGIDPEIVFMRDLRKDNLWPIHEKCESYSEDDLFDVIEFLFDHISKPETGSYHEYAGCGWHYRTFDRDFGKEEYRADINLLLHDYEEGFILTEEGEIWSLPASGLDTLIGAPIPSAEPKHVTARVETAVRKFRNSRTSQEERRDAIRDLVDVLEYLRPQLKEVFTKADEADLFNIANNFGIRHHRSDQKTEYDKPIWYSWMFYYYLATIHAAIRLIEKHEQSGSDAP